MNNERYVVFETKSPHIDRVLADDMNQIQTILERTQEGRFRATNEIFKSHALTTLLHHPKANAAIIDTLVTSDNFEWTTDPDLRHDTSTGSIVFDEGSSEEESIVTVALTNENQSLFRHVLLVVEEYKEETTNITYELSYDGVTYHPLTPNDGTMLELEEEDMSSEIYLKITFTRSNLANIARVDAWALIYHDLSYHFKFLEDGLNIDIEDTWNGRIVP